MTFRRYVIICQPYDSERIHELEQRQRAGDLDELETLKRHVDSLIERKRPSPADKFQGFSLGGEHMAKLLEVAKTHPSAMAELAAKFGWTPPFEWLASGKATENQQAPGSLSAQAETLPPSSTEGHSAEVAALSASQGPSSQAPGSGSASAEAVPGDSVGHDHTGDAASPSAPPASSPHPRQEPLSYQPFWDAGTCQVCHRPLPLCEC